MSKTLPNVGGRYVLEKGTARRVDETPAPEANPAPAKSAPNPKPSDTSTSRRKASGSKEE